jgi:thiamine biosynthesis protein ThiI
MKTSKVILLLSGGFDSSIAGFLLQQKGFEIIPLHFSNIDFAGKESIEKSKKIAKKFNWSKMYIIDIANALELFVDGAKHSYYFVLLKRLMLKLGSEIADIEKADFIATGESLGQVSSQTLSNISAIEEATRYRVLKPLITLDKESIIRLTRKFETFEISAGPEVCDILGPKHPITNAKFENILKEEDKLDNDFIINNSMKNMLVINI